ncbi:PucR family transcriptional regulator [Agromyces neolithicus]|uniref:Helix-turn-helix domain-containing protein n=1 Tax=Agromyces neolithicus TaxID=269420 RepID=A0ABN2M9A4_9MICO
MSERARSSLARVLDDLGATLLELVHGDIDGVGDIGGVVIYDPVDEPAFPERALVLGVAVSGEALPALVDTLGAHGAVALVVRAPVALTDELRSAIDASHVAVLGLARGATWSQIAAVLRSILAEGDIGDAEPETLGGLPLGDLFAVANAIAALIDAPVTIEDRSSRVLAFSGRQEEADPSRAETILGRQVPERYARMLTQQGVFRDLYRKDRPVVVEPFEVGSEGLTTQRVALAVRAGDEVLGSIWAAMDGPLTRERTDALRDAAKLVALHLLRVRAGADVQRRLATELVSTALEGGAGAPDALGRLGLRGQRVLVIGASLASDALRESVVRADQLLGERQRFADAFAMHLSAVKPGAAVAQVGEVAYAIVPASGKADVAEGRAVQVAQDFLDRVAGRMPARAAVGPPDAEIAGIAHSRAVVDRVLRVLRTGEAGRVARLEDVHTASLMLELRDLVASRADRPDGAIASLIEHDTRNDSELVRTLMAWLDAFGDVSAAASQLYVHPNTLRYRLRRLSEISGIDLDDPDHRFAAMLQLRLFPPHEA